jgi:hypothetical protein
MKRFLLMFLALGMTGCSTSSLIQTAYDVARIDGESIRRVSDFVRGFNVGDNPFSGTYQVDFELPDGDHYTLYFRTFDRPQLGGTEDGVFTMFFMAPAIEKLPELSILEDPDNAQYMGGMMLQKGVASRVAEAEITYALTFHVTYQPVGYEPLVHALWQAVEQRQGLMHAPQDFTSPIRDDDVVVLEGVQYTHDRTTRLYHYRATRVGLETY